MNIVTIDGICVQSRRDPTRRFDALLAVIGPHRDDPRGDRIDVGVGVYRDATGKTPVMRAGRR